MSKELLDLRGQTVELGFWATDTSQVMLGELAPMSIEQFSLYASATIVGYMPVLGQRQLSECMEIVDFALTKVDGIGERESTSDELSGFEPPSQLLTMALDARQRGDLKTHAMASGALSKFMNNLRGEHSVFYAGNPFNYKDGEVTVGDMYYFDPVDFCNFAVGYLSGGVLGWNKELGVPAEANLGLHTIKSTLNSLI